MWIPHTTHFVHTTIDDTQRPLLFFSWWICSFNDGQPICDSHRESCASSISCLTFFEDFLIFAQEKNRHDDITCWVPKSGQRIILQTQANKVTVNSHQQCRDAFIFQRGFRKMMGHAKRQQWGTQGWLWTVLVLLVFREPMTLWDGHGQNGELPPNPAGAWICVSVQGFAQVTQMTRHFQNKNHNFCQFQLNVWFVQFCCHCCHFNGSHAMTTGIVAALECSHWFKIVEKTEFCNAQWLPNCNLSNCRQAGWWICLKVWKLQRTGWTKQIFTFMSRQMRRRWMNKWTSSSVHKIWKWMGCASPLMNRECMFSGAIDFCSSWCVLCMTRHLLLMFVLDSPRCLLFSPKTPGECSGNRSFWFFTQKTKACCSHHLKASFGSKMLLPVIPILLSLPLGMPQAWLPQLWSFLFLSSFLSSLQWWMGKRLVQTSTNLWWPDRKCQSPQGQTNLGKHKTQPSMERLPNARQNTTTKLHTNSKTHIEVFCPIWDICATHVTTTQQPRNHIKWKIGFNSRGHKHIHIQHKKSPHPLHNHTQSRWETCHGTAKLSKQEKEESVLLGAENDHSKTAKTFHHKTTKQRCTVAQKSGCDLLAPGWDGRLGWTWQLTSCVVQWRHFNQCQVLNHLFTCLCEKTERNHCSWWPKWLGDDSQIF